MKTEKTAHVSSVEVVLFVWGHWKRHPVMLTFLIAMAISWSIADVLFPIASAYLVDAVATAGEKPDREALKDAGLGALFVLIQGFSYHFFRAAGTRGMIRFATNCMYAIVTEAMEKVQRYSADWHANHFSGATVRKISRGMWAYDLFADTVYLGLLPAFFVLTGSTITLWVQWPLIGFVVMASSLGYIIVTLVLAQYYITPANRLNNQADSAIGAALADTIACNPVVKSFGTEEREAVWIRTVVNDWRTKARTAWLRMENLTILQVAIIYCMKTIIFALVIWFWWRGEATVGGITFVLVSHLLIGGYLRDIGHHLQNLQKSINELDDVVAFSKSGPGVTDVPGALPLEASKGGILFEKVTFRYDDQSTALYNHFHLHIAPGEQVALVGPSGSGKSTFVKLLQRLYDIQEGRILIDGQDIAQASQTSVRQAIALVPQEPVLFHRTLAENIAYGRPGASLPEIMAAAKKARAHAFIKTLPKGYETQVGERGIKLSGGERQRVAIARAFLADAPVLVLDEATSSLDSLTESDVQQAVEELIKKRTTIIIAHRLSTVRTANRILVFEKGRIVEDGTYQQLASNKNGLFHALHEKQSAGLTVQKRAGKTRGRRNKTLEE